MSSPGVGWPNRARDILAYVGIGLGVLGLLLAWVKYNLDTGGNGNFPIRWVGLALNTPLVFWLLIRGRRQLWRQGSFWWAVGGLFALHSISFTVVLLKADQWPLVWFVPSDVIEVLAFSVTLSRLFPPWNAPKVHHPQSK